MFNTTGRLRDSPDGFFWIFTPDGDVYPEVLRVPPAAGLVWLNERNTPILTAMMPAGRFLEQVREFGAQRRIQPSSEVNVLPEASAPLAAPATPHAFEVDKGASLSSDDNVADPLLDVRVFERAKKLGRRAS